MTAYRDPDERRAAHDNAAEPDRDSERDLLRAGNRIEGILRLQRMAGNAATNSLLARPGRGAFPVVQRSPYTDCLRYGPAVGRSGLPEGRKPMHDPGAPLPTSGAVAVAGSLAIANAARKFLDRIALENERSAAITELMAKEPTIYDTLHANPGKGLIVSVSFKSTDPEQLPVSHPSDITTTMQVKFLGVSISEPFEFPEPSEGAPAMPAAAGAGLVSFGWKSTTLSASVRPVRPDPDKVKPGNTKKEVIESPQALAEYMEKSGVPRPVIAGQLQRGRRMVIETPTGGSESVVEVNAFGTRLLVNAAVAGQVAEVMMDLAREELQIAIQDSARRIEAQRVELDLAVRRPARRPFQIDPHLLDSPRAHLAAAVGYLDSGDLSNSIESLSACEDTIDLVRGQLRAYKTNDFSDPFRLSPTRVVEDLL